MNHYKVRKNYHYPIAIFIPILAAFLSFSFMEASAQPLLSKGDITGDGVIDGRDALKVLRAVENLETLSPAEMEKGDVFPIPGVGDRLTGDGVLTREDARRILQMSVGLYSEGEITGDFDALPPMIDDFYPKHGPAGTKVTIIGQNFVGSIHKENLVFFGDIETPVQEAAGTRLVVEVPAGAETNRLRVISVGGIDQSPFVFRVTRKITVSLQLDGGLNAQDFSVVNNLEESQNSTSNTFNIEIPQQEANLIAAVPKDDRSIFYLAFVTPESLKSGNSGTSSNPVILNAQTTAAALTLLHPYMLTAQTSTIDYLTSLAPTLPETQNLAQVIAQRFAANADGLNDAAVKTAWMQSVAAVLNALPHTTAFDVAATPAAGKTIPSRTAIGSMPNASAPSEGDAQTSKPTLIDSLTVSFNKADADLTNVYFDDLAGGLHVELNPGYSPLDWITTIYRVVPKSLPLGANTPYAEIRSNDYAHTGYERVSAIVSDRLKRKMDVYGAGVDKAFAGEDWIPAQSQVLPLENGDEAVYMLRSYSGSSFDRQGWDAKVLQAIPNGRKQSLRAASLNIVLPLVDLWAITVEEYRTAIVDAVHQGLVSCMDRLNQETASSNLTAMTHQQALNAYLKALESAGGAVRSAFTLLDIPANRKKLQKILFTALQHSAGSANVLSKTAAVGDIGSRLTKLAGYQAENDASPLESIMVLAGDPYKPSIHHLSPAEGYEGEIIKIVGRHFAIDPKDNFVTFGNELVAEPVDIQLLGEDMILSVKVPIGLISSVLPKEISSNVYVTTPASKERTETNDFFKVLISPILYSIGPNQGYAPASAFLTGPFAGFKGTEISLNGNYFDPRNEKEPLQVFFDDPAAGKSWEVPSTFEYSSRMRITTPDLKLGKYRIRVFNPNSNLSTDAFDYTILGEPKITTQEPSFAYDGQQVHVEGENFDSAIFDLNGEQIYPHSLTNTSFSIKIPETSENTNYALKIFTPAGKVEHSIPGSSEKRIPNLVALPRGFTVTPTDTSAGMQADGRLTLDEAIAFAGGRLSLFNPPYDDPNEEWTHHFNERKVQTGEDSQGRPVYQYQWEEANVDRVTLTIGNGPAPEMRRHFRVEHYHADHGGGVSQPALYQSESLDATANDKEEGDLITSLPSSLDWRTFIGSQTADEIIVTAPNSTWYSEGFTLTPQDKIALPNTSQLIFTRDSHSFEIQDGCSVSFGEVQARSPLTLSANSARILSGTFSGSRSDGIYFTYGSRGNIVGSNVAVRLCNGHGLYISGGGWNRIEQNFSVQYAGRNGINLSNSFENQLANVDIRNCGQDGVSIDGGMFNTIYGCLTRYNQGHGLNLSFTKRNEIYNVISGNNTKNGISVENSGFNSLSYGQSFLNQNGIELWGQLASENRISSFKLGHSKWENGDDMIAGNSKNGVYLGAGANHNDFNEIEIYNSYENGVLMEHENTIYNRIQAAIGEDTSNASEANIYFNGCEGHGVLIQKGASYNQLYACKIERNKKNGIAILDEKTVGNSINQALIGGRSQKVESLEKIIGANGGYGIYIEQARETAINECVIGRNKSGGILAKSAHKLENGAPTLKIYKTALGYTRALSSVTFNVENYMLKILPGDAIRIEDSDGAILDQSWIQGFDIGIYAGGVGSGYHTLNLMNIRNTAKEGIVLNGSSNDSIRATINAPQESGMILTNVQNLVLNKCTISSCEKNGIVVENGTNIAISNTTSQKNKQRGIHINNSLTVALDNVFIKNNGSLSVESEGLYMEDAREAVLQRVGVSDNVLDGARFRYVRDSVWRGLHPAQPVAYQYDITRNRNGIVLMDCRNFTLGEPGRLLTVNYNTGAGVLIKQGLQSQIALKSMVIGGNKKEGIRVEGGTGIQIGGFNAQEGCKISGNSEAGIYAEGQDSSLSIQYNTIGSYSYYGGNGLGVVLTNGIHDVVLHGNTIKSNRGYGAAIQGGSYHNWLSFNSIIQNSKSGVYIEGAESKFNTLFADSFFINSGDDILLNGGNGGIESPKPESLTWRDYNITGTANAPNGSRVIINRETGNSRDPMLLGTGYVFNNKFNISSSLPKGTAISALAIHPDGNTSELSSFVMHPNELPSIIFTSERAGKKYLAVQGPSDQKPVCLVKDDYNHYDPHYANGNYHLLFTSERSGNADLWLTTSKAYEFSQYTFHSAKDYSPDWLGGTSHVLFVSERDGNPEVYQIEVDPYGTMGELTQLWGSPSTTQFYSGFAGEALGVQYESIEGTLQEIRFYIFGEPAPFQWSVLPVVDGQPGDAPIASGITAPAGTGWHSVKLDNVIVPENYVVVMSFLEDGKPQLARGSNGNVNVWWFKKVGDVSWKLENYKPFCIDVVVGPLPPVRLTNDPAADLDPSWSHDGKRFAFTSNRGGSKDIYIANVDGTGVKKLTDGAGQNEKPAWSPNGDAIAFVSTRDGNEEIYLINIDGTNLTRITNNADRDTDPDWSYSGGELFFSSGRDSGMEIYMYRTWDKKTVRLTVSLADNTQPNGGAAYVKQTAGEMAGSQITSANLTGKNRTFVSTLSGEVELRVDSANMTPGETSTLNVYLAGAQSLGCLAFELNYDGRSFNLADAVPGSLGGNLGMAAVNPDWFPWSEGWARFGWIHASGVQGGFEALQLQFAASSNVPNGVYPLTLQNAQAFDIGLAAIPVKIVNGQITISGQTPVDSWMLF
ncbi:MAG: right-handed parallel beta-helix repeat-containing protein [Candidatus Omnitrophota bacterium]